MSGAESNNVAAATNHTAENGPTKPRNAGRKNKQAKADRDQIDDASVEIEFVNFISKLRKMNLGHTLAYQINNYPQGVECTFRIGRDDSDLRFTSDFKHQPEGATKSSGKKRKELKDLTPEQLAKIEAKRERKRAVRAKKIAEKKAAREAEAQAKSTDCGEAVKAVTDAVKAVAGDAVKAAAGDAVKATAGDAVKAAVKEAVGDAVKAAAEPAVKKE